MLCYLLGLYLTQLHLNQHLFEDIVVTIMLQSVLLPLVELLLQLEVNPKCFGLYLVQTW